MRICARIPLLRVCAGVLWQHVELLDGDDAEQNLERGGPREAQGRRGGGTAGAPAGAPRRHRRGSEARRHHGASSGVDLLVQLQDRGALDPAMAPYGALSPDKTYN